MFEKEISKDYPFIFFSKMEVVREMKKGYSLLEVLVSLVLLSALLVCVGIIFVKGLKYKDVANSCYEQNAITLKAISCFDRLWDEYQDEHLSIQNTYLVAGVQVIFSYAKNTIYFYYPDEVKDEVKEVEVTSLVVDNHLLEVCFKSNDMIIRKDYYYGGGR